MNSVPTNTENRTPPTSFPPRYTSNVGIRVAVVALLAIANPRRDFSFAGQINDISSSGSGLVS